jgi:hypothetical protein
VLLKLRMELFHILFIVVVVLLLLTVLVLLVLWDKGWPRRQTTDDEKITPLLIATC